jgi:hypothetical protein
MTRVARFFMGQTYQNGTNIPNYHKLYQITNKNISKNVPNASWFIFRAKIPIWVNFRGSCMYINGRCFMSI